MIHPARSMVESLHTKGACPRIQVDLTREGVVCPDFVREQWQEELIIDLDPTYPLNLSFTDEGIEADISFDGFVTRCTFPFDAIYVVTDRETHKGIVIQENMPESVRLRRQPQAKLVTPTDSQTAGKRTRASGQSRRRRRPRAGSEAEATSEQEAQAEPVAATGFKPAILSGGGGDSGDSAGGGDEDGGGDSESESAGSGEEEAQRRRSVFQVIDGDG
ncbi:MAG: hypothetical protein JKY37_18995 [Nannocystaceae bacterium]|nr:hypothetical protein [Nannocystaceae bacterium]